MIITVEGYNGKKNRATMTTAMLASMMAMKKGLKTLVLQLIDPNIDTVEGMLNGTGREKDVLRGQDSMSDEGIDALLREAEVQKLMKSDFDQYCTSILTAENLFDVASITKNGNFTSFLEARSATLQQCVENAMDVYECIIILLPTGMPHISKMVKDMQITVQDENGEPKKKSLVDKSIYCMRQGFMQKCEVSGDDIIYLLTDYDETSRFLGNDMAKFFCPKQSVFAKKSTRTERMYKVTRNVAANDASLSGTLARFVRENRQLDPEDSNFVWINDMTKLVGALTGEKEVATDDRWESLELLAQEPHVLQDVKIPTAVEEELVVTNAPKAEKPKKKGLFKKAEKAVKPEDEDELLEEAFASLVEDEEEEIEVVEPVKPVKKTTKKPAAASKVVPEKKTTKQAVKKVVIEDADPEPEKPVKKAAPKKAASTTKAPAKSTATAAKTTTKTAAKKTVAEEPKKATSKATTKAPAKTTATKSTATKTATATTTKTTAAKTTAKTATKAAATKSTTKSTSAKTGTKAATTKSTKTAGGK